VEFEPVLGQARALVGGIVGPIGFGTIVSASGYRLAWTVAVAIAGVAAMAMLYSSRRLTAAADRDA
jgi:hypothetical protein